MTIFDIFAIWNKSKSCFNRFVFSTGFNSDYVIPEVGPAYRPDVDRKRAGRRSRDKTKFLLQVESAQWSILLLNSFVCDDDLFERDERSRVKRTMTRTDIMSGLWLSQEDPIEGFRLVRESLS